MVRKVYIEECGQQSASRHSICLAETLLFHASSQPAHQSATEGSTEVTINAQQFFPARLRAWAKALQPVMELAWQLQWDFIYGGQELMYSWADLGQLTVLAAQDIIRGDRDRHVVVVCTFPGVLWKDSDGVEQHIVPITKMI